MVRSPQSMVAVLRWAVGVYRGVLAEVAPQRCRQVDEMIARTGRAVQPTLHLERLDDGDLLNREQTSEILNRSKRSVDEYRRRGKLRGVKVDRTFYFRVGDIRKFLAARGGASLEGDCTVIANGGSLSSQDSP